MNLIQESYQRLFPDKELSYQTILEYNRRLAPFNANILLHQNNLAVHLNLQWKDIDREIKIGLIQHLLLKLFKQRAMTTNIDLYNRFVKNIPMMTKKTKSNPVLALSFSRVNRLFFEEQLEKPNLQWGQNSFHKIAHYNFHTDTVTVSSLLEGVRQEILDYVMYHELLHKHHKFEHGEGRSRFHTREFRMAEKLFPGHDILEKELARLLRTKRTTRRWWFFP